MKDTFDTEQVITELKDITNQIDELVDFLEQSSDYTQQVREEFKAYLESIKP